MDSQSKKSAKGSKLKRLQELRARTELRAAETVQPDPLISATPETATELEPLDKVLKSLESSAQTSESSSGNSLIEAERRQWEEIMDMSKIDFLCAV